MNYRQNTIFLQNSREGGTILLLKKSLLYDLRSELFEIMLSSCYYVI